MYARYPPKCDVQLGGPQCPVNVDFVEGLRFGSAAAFGEAELALCTSGGEDRRREGDELRQFPQVLGGGGQ